MHATHKLLTEEIYNQAKSINYLLIFTGCKRLLRQLLEANPERRIKMDSIMAHPWMNEGHALPFGPAPYPNTLTLKDVNTDIVEHMVHALKVSVAPPGSFCAWKLISIRIFTDWSNKWWPCARASVKQSHLFSLHLLSSGSQAWQVHE